MKSIVLVVISWLHLIATVTWIGGITFILFIAMPAAKELLGSEASKLMAIISKRFAPFANYSILLLIVTGISIMLLDGGSYKVGNLNLKLGLLVFKHTVVLFMVIIHFYRGTVLTHRIQRTQTTQQLRLQKLSLSLVKINLVLGLSVLLLSTIS